MQTFINKFHDWLIPAVLILFILEVVTFPFVLGLTWAGSGESPERVLTYTPGRLTWDSAGGINPSGVAVISLFDSEYENVKSDNGDKIVAPGTQGGSIVRLKNDVGGEIEYTAVLYRIRSSEDIPVEAYLSGSGFANTSKRPLPEGVESKDVIQAVAGRLGGGLFKDFSINWQWQSDKSAEQDITDTSLGDKAANGRHDNVTVGLYIVVEDGNPYGGNPWQQGGDVIPLPDPEDDDVIQITEGGDNGEDAESEICFIDDETAYITPTPPQTGDKGVGAYIVLMCISGLMLLLLLVGRKRGKCAE